ncbi:MAG: hypothetical protein KDN19_08350 [Verrucomicrobiae bacterium]|nr:hypothetical protein [Verrucomicrobiae bacterium]
MITKSFAVAALLAAFSFTAETSANEIQPKAEPQSIHRATPIQNYWDANSWDRSGGASLFWHALKDDRPVKSSSSPAPNRNTRRSHAEKKTTHPNAAN